eukprot:sb/3476275/
MSKYPFYLDAATEKDIEDSRSTVDSIIQCGQIRICGRRRLDGVATPSRRRPDGIRLDGKTKCVYNASILLPFLCDKNAFIVCPNASIIFQSAPEIVYSAALKNTIFLDAASIKNKMRL